MPHTSGKKLCPKTGLQLVSCSSQRVWRVARTSYGAFNPQLRDIGDVSRQQWGRWDPPGYRTIYAADLAVAAFMETLAWSRPSGNGQSEKYFTDAEPGETLHAVIATEWASRGTMGLWNVPASWRDGRNLYELVLPETGWFVDVTDANSLKQLTAAMSRSKQLTVHDLTGEDRDLTTKIGKWIHDSRLFDGSQAVGIMYPSKFGVNHLCYSAWLAKAGQTEQIKIVSANPILKTNPNYKKAARLLNISAH